MGAGADTAGHVDHGELDDPLHGAPAHDPAAFLQSLTETRLYAIGAYFCDRHPDLVEDVVAQSEEIERLGLERYAERDGVALSACFQTLVTGLAVRYFNAVAGGEPG